MIMMSAVIAVTMSAVFSPHGNKTRLGKHRAFTFPQAQSKQRVFYAPIFQQRSLPLIPLRGGQEGFIKNHLNCHCEETARSTRQSILIFVDRHTGLHPVRDDNLLFLPAPSASTRRTQCVSCPNPSTANRPGQAAPACLII